jgi:hypothetical protein
MKWIGMIIILIGMHILIFPSSVFSEDKNEDKKVHYVGEIQVTAPGTEDNLKIDVPVSESTYQVGATAVWISPDRVWEPPIVQWSKYAGWPKISTS